MQIFELDGQGCLFAQDTWSGKTYPELSVQTKGPTSKPSSQKSSASQNRKLLMLKCLTTASGPAVGATTPKWGGGAWPTAPWTRSIGEPHSGENGLLSWRTSTDLARQTYSLTLNTGEKPRAENPTRLSGVLEQNADAKYHLSPKACQGILNRAERRGKELPKELKTAASIQAMFAFA